MELTKEDAVEIGMSISLKESKIWGDDKFNKLSDEYKLKYLALAIMSLTNYHECLSEPLYQVSKN